MTTSTTRCRNIHVHGRRGHEHLRSDTVPAQALSLLSGSTPGSCTVSAAPRSCMFNPSRSSKREGGPQRCRSPRSEICTPVVFRSTCIGFFCLKGSAFDDDIYHTLSQYTRTWQAGTRASTKRYSTRSGPIPTERKHAGELHSECGSPILHVQSEPLVKA